MFYGASRAVSLSSWQNCCRLMQKERSIYFTLLAQDYENGIITADQALGQLKYKEVNHQLCILNQDVVDNFLYFVKAEKVIKEERL